MTKPIITIITPVYNCAEFIGRTIYSVAMQDYPRITHYVIDDASTDNPVFPDEKYIEYVLIKRGINLGEQCTVNEGLQLVKQTQSKYFMIVNADDPLLPGAITNLVAFMETHSNILCAYPDWRSIDSNDNVRMHVKSREYDFQWMVRHHNWLPSVGSIFRSTIIDMIGYRDTSFRWLGDADYWLRVGLAGQMAHVPIELACWRLRDGQATYQKSSKRASEHIRCMQKFYAESDMPKYLRDVKREAFCWSYLVATAVTDSKKDIVRYIFKAFIMCPWMIVSFSFWDITIKRVRYLLRR